MKKIIASILIVFVVSMAFIVTAYSQESDINKFIFESKIFNSELLSKKLVRFHVIANSDTDVDQEVKLQVKDEVLQYMVPKLNVAKSKQETIEIINENAKNIKDIAKSTLEKNNMTNEVTVVLNTTFFPTKYYNDFSLPAGDYLALRVIIGSGEGQNWWCVLFPPLCLVDVKKEEVVEPDTEAKDEDEGSISSENMPVSEEIPESEDLQVSEDIPVSEDSTIGELISEELVLEKKSNLNVNLKSNEDSQEKNQNSGDKERPQIRWKALELIGFYKNSQNQ